MTKKQIALKKKIKEMYRKQKIQDNMKNITMKKKGAKYVLMFWVHPSQGGDDYEIYTYLRNKPTIKQIKSHIKNKGSDVLTDYYLKKL